MWCHRIGRVPFLASVREALRCTIYAASIVVTGSTAALAQDGAALNNVFDPDLADVKPSEALSNAIKKGQQGRECYPPRMKMTIVTPGSGDDFANALAKARAEAMAAYLSAAGVPKDQFQVLSTMGALDTVLVTYGELSTDKDREAPKFKLLRSDPQKGTKVKAGDKIKVTIIASERYEDGHKSWPTGVRATQLREAQAGILHVEEYGQAPPPCGLARFEWTYTVPANPPKIIKLIARTEDGVGNAVEEEANFPTVDLWKGTINLERDGRNPSCSAITSTADFTVEVGSDGIVSGSGIFEHSSYTCKSRGSSHTFPATHGTIKVQGKKEAGTFSIYLSDYEPKHSPVPRLPIGQWVVDVGKSPNGEATFTFGGLADIIFRIKMECGTCSGS